MKSVSKPAIVTTLLIALFLFSGSAPAYELTDADRDFLAKKIIARCEITQSGQVDALYRHGIDILEDRPYWGKGYVTILVDADEFDELVGVGFKLDVVTDDWYQSYADKSALTMGGFQTFDEIAGELLFTSFVHSDIVSLFSIGQSIEGRDQWVLKISDNPEIDEDEPEVFFNGLTHAREPSSAAILMETISRLTDGYGSDTLITRLVDEREIFLLPVVNPDGYVYNEMIAPNGGGMWRKNRNPEFAPDYGVDLNRNYGYMWGYNDIGSSPDPSSATYRGTAPFSEPETANLRAFINSHEFVFTMNYHSHSDLYLWSWSYDYIYTPDEYLFQAVGDSMATFNGYYPTIGWGLYPVNGGADDWNYGATDEHPKIFSYTPEVGYWFWPNTWDIAGEIEENQEPNLLIIKLADDPERLLPAAVPTLTWELTADFECEYNAPPGGIRYETLTIGNDAYGSGEGTLIGDVTVTAGGEWLSVPPTPFALEEGNPDVVVDVTMDAGGLMMEGLYVGNIQITHNDPAQSSPVDIPVEFFVFGEFHCPQAQVLKTGVASPGILSLEVSSNARFGSQNEEGGMWRYLDSSSTVFDASFVLAHGTQGPDTVVFHRFYGRNDPGQFGWRSTGDLVVDTSAYGIGAGDPDAFARATANMTTADSVITVDVEWYFPQSPAFADFVIAKYSVSNRTASPVNDVVVGLWMDLNVTAAAHLQDVQDGVGNHGSFVVGQNLLYQYGYDVLGHTPVDDLNSSQRYSGGVSYLLGRDASGAPFGWTPTTLRAGIYDNRLNQEGGGPTSGQMYQTLVGPLGVAVWEPYPHPDSAKDLFTWLTLDQGRTLDPNGFDPEVYVVALVCDTLAHDAYPPSGKSASANLGEIVDSAWAWAERTVMCRCPCHADPQCDGVTNVLDVVHGVNVSFRGSPPVFDDGCPAEQTDVDCSGYTNVIDVVKLVNVAFRGGDPAVQFCDPCP